MLIVNLLWKAFARKHVSVDTFVLGSVTIDGKCYHPYKKDSHQYFHQSYNEHG